MQITLDTVYYLKHMKGHRKQSQEQRTFFNCYCNAIRHQVKYRAYTTTQIGPKSAL